MIAQLAGRALAGRLALADEGGLLAQLTKRLVDSALEGETTPTSAYNPTTPPAGMAETPATGTGPTANRRTTVGGCCRAVGHGGPISAYGRRAARTAGTGQASSLASGSPSRSSSKRLTKAVGEARRPTWM